jgi:hypothetical protein
MACGLALGVTPRRASDPTVPELLAAAGRYVADYESAYGAVVSEETCVQSGNFDAVGDGPKRRVITSDVLMFRERDGAWMVLRDPRGVDGQPIDRHSGRFAQLAADPTPSALEEAVLVTRESARYDLAPMARTGTSPVAGLVFLRPNRQSRSAFEWDGMNTVAGLRVAVLRFTETGDVPLMAALGPAQASGRFWIEPGTGRVVQSKVTVKSRDGEAGVDVQYAPQPSPGLWLPVRMFERHTTFATDAGNRIIGGPDEPYVDALSTYRNFRRFEHKPGLTIK